jgi:indole-3-glycerol phosphate synthase
MSGDFLAQMARASHERVARARTLCPDATLRRQARALPPAPRLALSDRGFDLIAEVKLRSPALGRLSTAGGGGQAAGTAVSISAQIEARVRAYADAGAALVSVLTEPTRFDGSLAHLEQAAQALGGRVPVMRKDFLVDPYQVYEARVAGAGGVLLILRMLAPAQQAALIEATAEMGLFALLEGFDAADLERAGELVSRYRERLPLLLGVNCRDLSTLEVVLERLEDLARYLPRGVPCVAESGIQADADVERVVRAGYDLALVGGALMRSEAPGELIAALLAVGRGAKVQRKQCDACR